MALWPGRGRLGLAKPNLLTTTSFLFWLCIDLFALAAALWVLLPFLFFARVYYVRRPPPVPMVPLPSGSIKDRVHS